MQNDDRTIVRNTIFLYVRMIVIMVVTFFTSRVVLMALGVEDYGIYNLVGGIAAVFNLLSGILADATQRYIVYETGRGNPIHVQHVFSTAVVLHFIIGILIVILAEPAGIWFIKHKLLIPQERIVASVWVLQCTLASLFFMVMSAPFNALIIAREKMAVFAYISSADAVIRLIVAYSIKLCFANSDKLIVYAALLALSQIVVCLMYFVYCRRNFTESKFNYSKDVSLVKEMGGFAAWTVFGNLAYVCYTQGINLLLGTFFLPVISAARGIAVQVQGAMNSLVRNFQQAINPQIVKNYSSGNTSRMYSLVSNGSRFSYYLMLVPLIPLLFETEELLTIWLKEVPEYSVPFVRIMLITQLFITLRNPFEMAIKATGKLKTYELTVSSLGILSVPLAYLSLKLGGTPVVVFMILLGLDFLSFVFTLLNVKFQFGIDVKALMSRMSVRMAAVTVLSVIFPFIVNSFMNAGWQRLLVQLTIPPVISLALIFFIGLDKYEKSVVKNKVSSMFRK